MKSDGKALGGRGYLVEKLRERGLSRRQAVRILNFILKEMKKTLRRGGSVEFPLGKLKRVRRHFSKEWGRIDDWPAGQQPYTVEWELDEAGDRLLNGRGNVPVKGARPWRRAGKGVRKRAFSIRKSGK
jgi:ribosomal protein L13E